MRGRAMQSAFALSSAALVAFGIAGCQQQSTSNEGGAAPSDLKIVEQNPIDQIGAEVKPPEATEAHESTKPKRITSNFLSVRLMKLRPSLRIASTSGRS